jgi:hypothetical protein
MSRPRRRRRSSPPRRTDGGARLQGRIHLAMDRGGPHDAVPAGGRPRHAGGPSGGNAGPSAFSCAADRTVAGKDVDGTDPSPRSHVGMHASVRRHARALPVPPPGDRMPRLQGTLRPWRRSAGQNAGAADIWTWFHGDGPRVADPAVRSAIARGPHPRHSQKSPSRVCSREGSAQRMHGTACTVSCAARPSRIPQSGHARPPLPGIRAHDGIPAGPTPPEPHDHRHRHGRRGTRPHQAHP